jgi:23S rRNA pseudouridine1911/1915/1917 synthase
MSEVQPASPPTGEPAPLTRVVPPEAAGARLDAWLASALGIGRRAAARLADRARVNGRRAAKGSRVAAGDVVSVAEPGPLGSPFEESDLVLRITPDLLVLDKPAGLPAIAIAGRTGESLAAWIAERHPECAGVGHTGESGLVHRLDNDTSGLILAARHPHAYQALREQFRRHEVEKTYLALVSGTVADPLSLDAPIGHHPKSTRRMRVVPPPPAGDRYESFPALSIVEPERALAGATLVRVRARTGVRHQVRVHLAAAGHPLVGDRLYGGPPCSGAAGHLLHAVRLAWRDAAGASEVAESPVPARWHAVIESLA